MNTVPPPGGSFQAGRFSCGQFLSSGPDARAAQVTPQRTSRDPALNVRMQRIRRGERASPERPSGSNAIVRKPIRRMRPFHSEPHESRAFDGGIKWSS
jgi:hypothetical protein